MTNIDMPNTYRIFGDIFREGTGWRVIGLNLKCQAKGKNFNETLTNFRIAAKKVIQNNPQWIEYSIKDYKKLKGNRVTVFVNDNK